MVIQIPSIAFALLSFFASLAISFLLLAKRRSILFLIALAAVLFVLFGPLALPAFFLSLFAAPTIFRERGEGKQKKKRRRRA